MKSFINACAIGGIVGGIAGFIVQLIPYIGPCLALAAVSISGFTGYYILYMEKAGKTPNPLYIGAASGLFGFTSSIVLLVTYWFFFIKSDSGSLFSMGATSLSEAILGCLIGAILFSLSSIIGSLICSKILADQDFNP